MASLLEMILQDVASAVQGIRKADGYYHTMPKDAVFRRRQRGEPTQGVVPSANVAWLRESSEEAGTTVHDDVGHGDAKTTVDLVVDVWLQPKAVGIAPENDDADSVAWAADIVRAVMQDPQRGGNALRTTAGDRSPWQTQNAQYFGLSVVFSIEYRHREEDPSVR